MPRSLWTGSVSFGLVNVPVRLFSTVRDVDVHFRQLHEKDGAPIETRRFCSQEEREVEYDEIGHAYELEDGGQVVLTDEDLAAVAPRKTRTVDIEAFVDLADVDPILFDHPYFLAPAGDTEGARRAYQLLVEVMGSTDRAALGRFVLRSKEHLVLLRVRDGRLALTTLLFHDEIRDREGIETGGAKPEKAQLDGAVALIEELSVDWDPGRYEDRYRERLLKVIERKKGGERITVPKEEKQPAPVPDLMAALRRSLDDVRERERDGGGRRDGDGDGDGDGLGRLSRDELYERERDGGGRRDGDGDGLGRLSRDELYERAQEEDVPGRSSMSKEELIEALAD